MIYAIYNTIIIEDDEIYADNENYSIKDTLQLENNKTLISYLDSNKLDNIDLALKSEFNISMSIVSAIKTYTRMHMTNLKMELIKLGYLIFNTETDNLFIDNPLSDFLVKKELDKLKLENLFTEIILILILIFILIFLTPKIYADLYEIDNIISELIKVKGFKFNNSILSLKNKIELNNESIKLSYLNIKNLLIKDSNLQIKHEKVFRDFEKGNIKLTNQLYNLIATENKRRIIYDNNIFTNIKSFVINKNKEIIN
jgi:hypothetical protein